MSFEGFFEFERQRKAEKTRELKVRAALPDLRRASIDAAVVMLDDAVELCRSGGFELNVYYSRQRRDTSRSLRDPSRFENRYYAAGEPSLGWVNGNWVLTQDGKMLSGRILPREEQKSTGAWRRFRQTSVLCVYENQIAAGDQRFHVAPPEYDPLMPSKITWRDDLSATLEFTHYFEADYSVHSSGQPFAPFMNHFMRVLYERHSS